MIDLEGVRIVAITQYGAGPYATQLLAEMGAEVIKIERPGSGDYGRRIPPFDLSDGTDSLFYQSLNRGNRSVTLDLSDPSGFEAFRRLVMRSDALFSNVRMSKVDSLGLSYRRLRLLNEKLVCCTLTGYAKDGPRRDDPGFDYLLQAESGIMSLAGGPADPPVKAGISIIDFATGIAAAFALSAGHSLGSHKGLRRRRRRVSTGDCSQSHELRCDVVPHDRFRARASCDVRSPVARSVPNLRVSGWLPRPHGE
jgi:crotonobetainyl-CoA:carnitine CoA-transferase CaiB-like acyl-CoA transferase